MYILISVTRDELDICESFHATKKEAIDAMVEDIITSCGIGFDFESLDDIVEASNRGEIYFSDNEAWAETDQCGTGQWKIVEIPTDINH